MKYYNDNIIDANFKVIEKSFGLGGKKDISRLQKKEITNKRGIKQTVYVSYNHDDYKSQTPEGKHEYTADFNEDHNLDFLKGKFFFGDKKKKNKLLTEHFQRTFGKNIHNVTHEVDDNGKISLNIQTHQAEELDDLSKKLHENIKGYKGIQLQNTDYIDPDNEQEGDYYHHESDVKFQFDKLMKFAVGDVDNEDPEQVGNIMKTVKVLNRMYGATFTRRVLQHKLIREYNRDKQLQQHYNNAVEYVNEAPFADMIPGWKIHLTKEDRNRMKELMKKRDYREHKAFLGENANPEYKEPKRMQKQF